MSYSILSSESKQQLEQERLRLTQDRANIIASVTAEIDRLIQQIDLLLGGDTTVATPKAAPAKTTASAEVAQPNGRRKGKAKATSAAPATKASATKASATKAAEPKKEEASSKKGKRRKQKLFDAKSLKADFDGLAPTDALLQVMMQTPNQTYTTDEMIQELYDEFDEADLPRARKSVAGVFSRGMRFGKLEKIGENPSRYRLVDSAAS